MVWVPSKMLPLFTKNLKFSATVESGEESSEGVKGMQMKFLEVNILSIICPTATPGVSAVCRPHGRHRGDTGALEPKE